MGSHQDSSDSSGGREVKLEFAINYIPDLAMSSEDCKKLASSCFFITSGMRTVFTNGERLQCFFVLKNGPDGIGVIC